ncbi:MAG: ParB/RepB/Spo0J family partition protein [Lachnospiraceae bacterium]|nr:ParB/RepB/Spo0J family partition protein [Lachnospiraceae bacterium]
MAAKRGLGKGIDSMIPGGGIVVENKKTEKKTGTTVVKISEVEPNKEQPRKLFNEDRLNELAESIKQHGIIEPLIVVKKDDYYEIVAGERRFRAAMIAGLTEVPIVIKDYTPQQIVEIALIENIQREDLNPIEEAKAYKQLIEDYNLKQDEVAEKVSKSRTAITNSVRLLKLDERVQNMVIEECISSGHARALIAVENKDDQYELACKVFDEKLSVRETEKLIKKYNIKDDSKKKKPELENKDIYADFEEKLKQSMGTKVQINRKSNTKGKIEIEYYSEVELERLIGMLTR